MEESKKGTPDEKIVSKAKVWRFKDRKASAAGASSEDKRAEYHARNQLREAVDLAGGQP